MKKKITKKVCVEITANKDDMFQFEVMLRMVRDFNRLGFTPQSAIKTVVALTEKEDK